MDIAMDNQQETKIKRLVCPSFSTFAFALLCILFSDGKREKEEGGMWLVLSRIFRDYKWCATY
jgi:hypothetical protein